MNSETVFSTKFGRVLIGTFLVVGTLLALSIAVELCREMFFQNMIWWERDIFWVKALVIMTFADFVLLTVAGCVSMVSFFSKGKLWIPIVRGIIINVIFWLVVLLLIIVSAIC